MSLSTPVSPRAAAGKLTARWSLRACGVAKIATLALCISILGAVSAQAAFAEETGELPDNRVYEMVTPPGNTDADVYVPRALGAESVSEGTPTQFQFSSAVDGSRVTYQADPTKGGFGAAGNGLGNQYVARRGPEGGWTQTVIQPPARQASFYGGFSNDLSAGVVLSGLAAAPEVPPLAAGAPGEGYGVLYSCTVKESACEVGAPGAPVPQNPYRALFGKPRNRSPKAFGSHGVDSGNIGRSVPIPIFAGGSAGFGDLLFEANDALLAGSGRLEEELESDVKQEITNGENGNYLYDSASGVLGLVDVSQSGEVVKGSMFGGPPLSQPRVNPPDLSGVISSDGGRVYWTSGAGRIFLRENSGQPESPYDAEGECTVPADACTVAVSAGPAQYWTSGDDGRFAFYTESGALYRFDIEDHARELLGPTNAIGVVGAGEDGESVYLVSEAVLASGASGEGGLPVNGAPNLYLLRHGSSGWSPVFVATLSEEDGKAANPFITSVFSNIGEFGDWQPGFGDRTARVTSGNGGGVVFMSDRALPAVGFPAGYPSGGLDEVYMFEADANQLYCVSCSASGEAPPVNEKGAAAFLPISWSDTYLPQWVSDGGDRVFFDSAEPLVPQDTNGVQDVYEWEREDAGSCTSATAVNGGCVYLLSGGTSKWNSWFIGASSDGNAVFVATRAQLVPGDLNEAFDLYDVQVDGTSPITPPACTGTGCQGVPAPPPTFSTPSSVTFEGPGNFPAPIEAAKPPAKPKPAVKKKTVKCAKSKKLVHGKCVKRKQTHGSRASSKRRGKQ